MEYPFIDITPWSSLTCSSNIEYLKIDATNKYDNGLLLRQEAKKRLHVLEADRIKIKRTPIWCLLLKGCIFTERVPNDRYCADDTLEFVE